jgi:hypothetical protein
MAIFKLRFNLREWGFNRCVERGRKRQRGSARVQHAPESPDEMTEEFRTREVVVSMVPVEGVGYQCLDVGCLRGREDLGDVLDFFHRRLVEAPTQLARAVSLQHVLGGCC